MTKTLEGHSHGILGLWADAATSGAAPRVVSGGFDADLRQWDVTKGRCVRTMAGHGDASKGDGNALGLYALAARDVMAAAQRRVSSG